MREKKKASFLRLVYHIQEIGDKYQRNRHGNILLSQSISPTTREEISLKESFRRTLAFGVRRISADRIRRSSRGGGLFFFFFFSFFPFNGSIVEPVRTAF